MRLYVLCISDHKGIEPHIVAEVVHDALDKDLHTTLADSLAGDRARIMTRAELLSDPAGLAALRAWQRKDDSEFDDESESIRDEDDLLTSAPLKRRLHLVPGASGSSGG